MINDKNRIRRIRIIDEVLSKADKGVTMAHVVNKIKEVSGISTDRFAVRRDFKCMKNELGLDIVEEKISVRDPKNSQGRRVKIYRYRNLNSSLFTIDITDQEREFLSTAIEMLGLKGLSETSLFRKLKLKSNAKQSIISFTKNTLEKSIGSCFEVLWRNIRNHEVIALKIRDRHPPYSTITCYVHPWYLREYNKRWYLFGFDEKDGSIKHFALDRIKPPIRILKREYKPPFLSIENILEHTIGVSLPKTEPIEILFWVSDKSLDFVQNKPLHSSQIEIQPHSFKELEQTAINYSGGKFFKIFCKNNYELRRELLCFGKELIVLYPNELKQQLIQILKETLTEYVC